MPSTLLRRARLLARKAGLDVQRHDPHADPAARLAAMLRRHAVDLVIDAGANDGGFVRSLRGAGWGGSVLSFEPLAVVHAQLVRHAAGDAQWHVAPPIALGERHAQSTMSVAGNAAASSSLRPMLDLHREAEPTSATVAVETVALRRLDDLAADPGTDPGLCQLVAAQRPFLKIDTQGYEAQVLQGAATTLARCVGVQLELSLVPLYDAQALWRELAEGLERAGFEPWDLVPGFRDPRSGRLLQADAVFFRTTR